MAKATTKQNAPEVEANAEIDNSNAGPFKMVKGTIEDKGKEPEPQFVNIPEKPGAVETITVSHEFSNADNADGSPKHVAIEMQVQRMSIATDEENA